MSRNTVYRIAAIGAAVIVVLQCEHASPLPRYTVTDLGAASRGMTCASGINSSGDVAGYTRTGPHKTESYLWSKGHLQRIRCSDSEDLSAMALNDRAEVVGAASLQGQLRGFLWRKGKITILPTLGGDMSFAWGVNNSGEIVGIANREEDRHWMQFRAFAWKDGVIRDLGALGGPASCAFSINNRGQIAGWSQREDGGVISPRAVLWDRGSLHDLGTLPGHRASVARAVSENGLVVGTSVSSGSQHVCVWRDRQITDLGSIPDERVLVYGINNEGQVAGFASRGGEHTRAMLWEASGRSDLNALIPKDSGWLLLKATGINNRGQITGDGLYHGARHCFRLEPVTRDGGRPSDGWL